MTFEFVPYYFDRCAYYYSIVWTNFDEILLYLDQFELNEPKLIITSLAKLL